MHPGYSYAIPDFVCSVAHAPDRGRRFPIEATRKIQQSPTKWDSYLMRAARFLVIPLILISWPRAAIAEDEAWKVDRLWVVGGDNHAWVVGASRQHANHPSVVRMWYLGPKDDAAQAVPRPSPKLPPVSANPVRIGADGEALRLLLSNSATWHYFPDRPALAGDLWSNHCRLPPLAWGGDASKPILWALARTADLITPQATTSSQPTSAETRDNAQPDDLPADSAEQSRLTLMQLRAGFWSRSPVLDAAQQGQTFWLAGRDGDAFLFWQTAHGTIRFSRRSGDDWSSPETVVEAPGIVAAWAGATEQGPVFIAGQGESARAVQLSVYQRSSDGWSTNGPAREGNDFLSLDAEQVGVVRDRLAVARGMNNGDVEFGWADLRASPLMQFGPLSMLVKDTVAKPKWEDAVVTALVLGAVTLLMFRRRDQVNRPAAVPRGFVIAEPWRRILATAIDLAPAMLLVMPWSWSMFPSDDPAVLFDLLQDPEFVARFRPVNLVLVTLYGLWCFIWELKTNTTPGKRIFGCRVLTTDGTAPTARQVLLRNVCRSITFALGPPTLMVALLLMLILTRNRQRIGDLLADTVVVMRQADHEPPIARPSDRDGPRDTDA
jgi:uncharacterized RDD family membrane protein YckC